MANTIDKILKDSRYNKACTYIVRCCGEIEVYTRETKDKLIRDWGLEEATAYFLNTKELMINVR